VPEATVQKVTVAPAHTIWLVGPFAVSGASWVTVTLKEQVLVLQALVAVQITGVVPSPKVLPLAGTQPWSAPLVTVGFGKVTTTLVPQILVLMADGQVIPTAPTCVTVTLKEQVLVLQALVAVQITGVVPSPKELLLAGTQPWSTPPVTVGFGKVTTTLAPQILVLMADGQVLPTAATWVTVTLKEQVLVLQALVAVQITGVVPSPKELPLAGTQPRSAPPVTVGFGKVTTTLVPQILVLMADGQVIPTVGI